jgi:hypothetical protein
VKRRVLVETLAALLLALVPPGSLAQPDGGERVSEQSVKAAYLYRFADYVEWPQAPAAAGMPITIGVLGADLLAEELSRMTVGRSIDGRPIEVRRLEPEQPFADLEVLFIGADADDPGAVLALARALPLLTVTEAEGALADGSIVNFVTSQQRIRFEISLPAAESSGLRLDSGLLSVAERVYRTVPE